MRNAFTLIEILIYLAIISLILVMVVNFLWSIVFGNIKESSHQEIQQNARFVLTKMTQEIKKATAINSPLFGEPSVNSLSLSMADSGLNPTIFDIFDGKLRITQGSQQFYLTSDQVTISNLRFTNLSYQDTPGTIRIEMTVEYVNPENLNSYRASIDLNSTVSLVFGGAAP